MPCTFPPYDVTIFSWYLHTLECGLIKAHQTSTDGLAQPRQGTRHVTHCRPFRASSVQSQGLQGAVEPDFPPLTASSFGNGLRNPLGSRPPLRHCLEPSVPYV